MSTQQFLSNANVGTQDERGSCESGNFSITNRDTNSFLTIQLVPEGIITARAGVMVAMSPTVHLQGAMKFSMKKMLTGSQMLTANYTGPGELLLTGHTLGDIKTVHLDGNQQWFTGKDAFLASTRDVIKDNKTQNVGKSLWSGNDPFIYILSGRGTVWLSSFGAIVEKQLQPGESYVVDHGHLLAWNMQYTVEPVSGGVKSGQLFLCRFTGPGVLFLQSKNPVAFSGWLLEHGAAA